MNTPHIKVYSTIIVCLALITSVFIYAKSDVLFKKEKDPEVLPKKDLSTIESKDIADSDGDGLKDWEETLLGTNIKLADTDKDGTSDGEEVKKNRDPKKPGPNDIVSQTLSDIKNNQDTNTSNYVYGNDNLTNDIAQLFLSNYLTKKNGEPVSESKITEIVDNTLVSADFSQKQNKYSLKDINVLSNYSKILYEKELNDIIIKNIPNTSIKNELTIVNKALESQKESDLLGLDIIIKSYENLIGDLLKIKVPKEAVGLHMVFLNTENDIYENVKIIRKILNDPVKGYSAIENYKINSLKIKELFKEFENYFRS